MTLDIKKAEKLYVAITIFLMVSLAALFIFLLINMVKNINNALAPRGGKSENTIRFDIQTLDNIKKKL